jgi:hypothetical protein
LGDVERVVVEVLSRLLMMMELESLFVVVLSFAKDVESAFYIVFRAFLSSASFVPLRREMQP